MRKPEIGRRAGAMCRIVHLSDTQLGFTDAVNAPPAAESNGSPKNDVLPVYTDTDKRFYERAVVRMKRLDPRPDVVIHTGDLVDDFGHHGQWEDYRAVTDTIGFPVYEAIGNHDCTKDASGRYHNYLNKPDYRGVHINGVDLIILNSQYLKDESRDTPAAREQRSFVEDALAHSPEQCRRILVMHHPLYFNHPEEEETYFCLPVRERKWVLGLLSRYHVCAVLSGHYHRNHISRIGSTELITTGPVSVAMGCDSDGSTAQRGFRVVDVDVHTGGIEHEFVSLE
jgi:3',5'-cyclic AMP phosphodiesterase CpdA